MFRTTISKEEIAAYPLAEYEGHVEVIQTVKEAKQAVARLRQERVIGFDTETRPSFQKGKMNKVALLQLSTESTCFLFRINKIGIPSSLRELLIDSQIKKIGVAVKDDFRALNQLIQIQQVNFIDLQQYVKDFQIEEKSLLKIFAIVFEKRISKSQRLSNWETDLLTDKQKKYAALDAWATRALYVKLELLNTNLK